MALGPPVSILAARICCNRAQQSIGTLNNSLGPLEVGSLHNRGRISHSLQSETTKSLLPLQTPMTTFTKLQKQSKIAPLPAIQNGT